MANKTTSANPIMIQCPHCKSMVKSNRMAKHIARVHNNSEVTATSENRIQQEIPSTPFVHCPQCRQLVARENLAKHIATLHSAKKEETNSLPLRNIPHHPNTAIESESDPIGVKVIKALKRGQNYIATASYIKRCQNCHTRVIFLDVGQNSMKAFDVSAKNIILGTHACDSDGRSESLYTYSGGIVDSNRRRH